jgi:hypothetical protein
VHHGAGQGWHRDVRAMPCGCVWMASRERLGTSGNAAPALRALAVLRTPARRGRGDAYGRPTPGAARGIRPGGRHGASCEVTGWGTVGGALPRVRALGGDGVVQGRRGVRVHSLCEAGPGVRSQLGGVMYWGSMAAGWSTIKGRGRPWQGLASGYPPPPRCQARNDKGKGFENPWTPEGDPQQILSPLLVGLQKK